MMTENITQWQARHSDYPGQWSSRAGEGGFCRNMVMESVTVGTETSNSIITLKTTDRDRQTLKNSHQLVKMKGKSKAKSGYFRTKDGRQTGPTHGGWERRGKGMK